MEHLSESLQLNEGKIEMDIETFISFFEDGVDSDHEMEEYGLTEEDVKFIQEHCKMLLHNGGYDGDGLGAAEVVEEDWGIDLKKYCELVGVDYDEDEISLAIFWPYTDSEIDDPKLLKLFGQAAGMSNPKCGGMYFTAGYDAPTVILFDEKNQFTKKLFDGLEGMY